jgi:hypothetical protein
MKIGDIPSYAVNAVMTPHGRAKATKSVRDSRWGKWGAILLTGLLPILMNHCQSVDRIKEIKAERDISDRRWHAQGAVNNAAIGDSETVKAISYAATNTAYQTKESK